MGLDNVTIELDQGPAERVKITYVTNGINNPLIKQAMLQLISVYYDNRTDFVTGVNLNELPSSTKNILTSFKSMFV